KSMDIREIFDQVSQVAQDAIPHDLIGLSFLSEDGRTAPVYALSDGRVDHLPAPPTLPDRMAALERGFFIIRDAPVVDPAPRPVRQASLMPCRPVTPAQGV